MSIVAFDRVWEKYRIKFVKGSEVSWEEIWALQDVTFSLEKGEALGVIGENGSGKTTLLKVVAGMLLPDKGEARLEGRVSALMELGAGFNPEFTGRENIALNARTYGMEGPALQERLQEAVLFADIGRFIDAPVKYYSLGMYMRLAFALAVSVGPDVLLVDDVLAVGDEEAQAKCRKKIFELKNEGRTLIIVSHDMDMVRQLCDRVVLLKNGKVVRSGAPEAVISHYLETVGRKEGVAVMEQEGLRLTFNNGRLILRHKDELLTQAGGAYLAFFLPSANVWCSSVNFSWQIKESSPERLVACGTYPDARLAQEWALEFKGDELTAQISTQGGECRQAHLDLVLVPQYRRWRTLGDQGLFPDFSHKDQWQNLGVGDHSGGLLGLCPGETGGLPCLLFKREDPEGRVEILNTGYDREGRVLQVFSDKDNRISFGVRFFRDEEAFERQLQAAAQDLAKRAQAQKERKESQNSISSGPLRLFLDEGKKLIRLYQESKEVTGPRGLYSAFQADQKWFHPQQADWKIEKIDAEKIVLGLEFPSLSLTQTWVFSFSGAPSLHFKVESDAKSPLKATNQDIHLELCDGYKAWKTAYERGSFLLEKGFEQVYPIRFKNNRVSHIVFEAATGGSDFSFVSLSHPGSRVMGLHKRKDGSSEFVCLSSSRTIPKSQESLESGRQLYFEGEISLGGAQPFAQEASGETAELKDNGLRLVFENGRGRIFYGRDELTTGLSVYTSLRSGLLWLDSFQAVWQLREKQDKKIVMTGHWPHVPVSQTWQFEIRGTREIFWRVETQVHQEMGLGIEQANLMLSSAYRRWQAPPDHVGVFSDEFTEDYDILPFRFWYGATERLQAAADRLPEVTFRSVAGDPFLRGLVENTDTLYRARLLQYQRVHTKKLLPGKYIFFEGVIEVAA